MLAPNGVYLKGLFNSTKALGDKAISSDATFEIKGFENISLLIKQFPSPTLSPQGEIEVPMPMGSARWQPQQLKINQQGQISLMETQGGHIAQFMENILAQGARFDATIYEGTPAQFSRKCEIVDSFIQLDNPDRDWENRAQIMMVTGTLFFHYFGAKT
jgi:hypothetical protein